MRIAMIGPFGLHPKQTMRSRALPLAKALTTKGHDLCLFMPPWHTPDEADKTWVEEGVRLRYVPLNGRTLGITRHLTREVQSWQPDIVYGFKPKAYSGLVLWWLWQFQRQRLSILLDTDDWEGWGGWNDREEYTAVQKKFFAWQEKWGMTHCHTLTVASRALETIALSMGVPADRVLYLPNGPGISVSAERQGVNGGRAPTILVYSRLFEFDVNRLVTILQGVKTAVPNLQVLFVGAGLFAEDGEQLRQLLKAHSLLDCVTDVGWVEPEKLPETLTQADVGIYLMEDSLLNRTKCPVKLADMLSLGIPVVGEAVGQVPEYVIHGRTGLLGASGDSHGLTQALIQLLQNPAKRLEMGQTARQHIQTYFSWHTLAAQLEKHFNH